MKTVVHTIVIFIIAGGFLAGQPTQAQYEPTTAQNPFPTTNAPSERLPNTNNAPENDGGRGLVPCDGPDCNFCHLGELVNNVLNWLIGIFVAVAVIIFVWAGFRLLTSGGNPDTIAWVKQRFLNVLIGLLLMLSAWLIIDLLLKGLTGSEKGMNFWGDFGREGCGGAVQANQPENPGDRTPNRPSQPPRDELCDGFDDPTCSP